MTSKDSSINTIDREGNTKNAKIKKRIRLKQTGKFEYHDIGFYLITPLLVGVFLGLSIDRLMHKKGVFVPVFILFGLIASIYNLIRLVKQTDAKD